MRHVFVLTLMLATAASAEAQSLTARTVRFPSEVMGGTQATFAILLPPAYATSEARYPVVYLLHGGTQNHTAFPARAWFAKEVSRRGMIVVMPHVPQSTYSVRTAASTTPFIDFIVRDLVPYVDANYRTTASRESRAIAGLSMGGYGAVLAGLTHPEFFGNVGAFSGAFTAGREGSILEVVNRLDPDAAPTIYLACGVEDTVITASREFDRLLTERTIAHEYREVPGGHTWDVWDPQTLAFLDLLSRQPAWPRPR